MIVNYPEMTNVLSSQDNQPAKNTSIFELLWK